MAICSDSFRASRYGKYLLTQVNRVRKIKSMDAKVFRLPFMIMMCN